MAMSSALGVKGQIEIVVLLTLLCAVPGIAFLLVTRALGLSFPRDNSRWRMAIGLAYVGLSVVMFGWFR